MKVFLISILIFSFSMHGYSQLLKGEWEGSFTQDNIDYPIFLEFVLNPDSTYSVYTYTHGGLSFQRKGDQIRILEDSVSVCKAYYERLSTDSIYIEEIKIIHPVGVFQMGLQRMYLKIILESDKIRLTGFWHSRSGNGKINFWKTREY